LDGAPPNVFAPARLGPCGYFASRSAIGGRPVGPSPVLNLYGLARAREMTADEIEGTVDDFSYAARSADRSPPRTAITATGVSPRWTEGEYGAYARPSRADRLVPL